MRASAPITTPAASTVRGSDRCAFADRDERADVHVRADRRGRIDDGARMTNGPAGRVSNAASSVASAKRGDATATIGFA